MGLIRIPFDRASACELAHFSVPEANECRVSHHEVLSGQQTRVAEAAFTNNVAWPRSDPDVSSRDQIQGNATCGERLGTAHNIMRSVPLRQCDDFVTIRAGDLAVTTIRAVAEGKGHGRFSGPYSLQSSSKPPISEAPVRSNGWAALSLLVRAPSPSPPRALYQNLSCQGLRELD